MIAREAAFNDAEVVKLLSEKFVPLSIDNVANPNLTAAEKEFLDGFDSGIKACTIGMSVFTADGKKLGSVSAKEPGPVRQMLQGALDVFKPATNPGDYNLSIDRLREYRAAYEATGAATTRSYDLIAPAGLP